MPFVRTYGVGGGGGGGGVTGSSDGSLTIAGVDAIINQAITPTWTGAHTYQTSDAATNTATTLVSLSHRSSGTPAAAFGVGMLFKVDSSAKTLRTAGEVDCVWSTATDGAEVSSLAFKTMLAGVLTEVARFGTGASLPDSDLSFSVGRALIDARTTDTANFSHRDMTTTAQHAITQSAAGLTQLNSASGQPLNMAIAGSTKFQITSAGHLAQSTATRQFQGLDANGAGTPNFSFVTDVDTGMYNVGANSLGFATGGTKKLAIDTYMYQPAPSGAPTDGNLHASSICWYLIEGSNTIQARVKYADGTTLKSLTTALALS